MGDLDPQKLMGKTDGASHPISTNGVLPQAKVPVKVTGTSFQSRCQVTQPQRLPDVVMQQVGAKNPQLVLRTQHSDLDFLEPHQTRVSPWIGQASLAQLGKSRVQIHFTFPGFGAFQNLPGS